MLVCLVMDSRTCSCVAVHRITFEWSFCQHWLCTSTWNANQNLSQLAKMVVMWIILYDFRSFRFHCYSARLSSSIHPRIIGPCACFVWLFCYTIFLLVKICLSTGYMRLFSCRLYAFHCPSLRAWRLFGAFEIVPHYRNFDIDYNYKNRWATLLIGNRK